MQHMGDGLDAQSRGEVGGGENMKESKQFLEYKAERLVWVPNGNIGQT